LKSKKKFLLTSEQQRYLLEGAEKLQTKTVTDSYYDTSDYQLTRRDFWLRLRDGSYELKAPLRHSSTKMDTNQYHELTDITDIVRELKLPSDGNFEAMLTQAGITQFVTCFTQRASYSKQGFHIDVDTASYADSGFHYALAEIELLVENEDQAEEAEQRIIAFAQQNNLKTDTFILGKIGEFIHTQQPERFDALVRAGVLKDDSHQPADYAT
jgi:adenylate cyclase class IV